MKVNDTLMQDAIREIKKGIIRKLDAAKKMIEFDKEIAAGIYVYAVEELGKLEVIKGSSQTGQDYIIDYRSQFKHHDYKFLSALAYLEEKNHPECIYLSKGFSHSFTKVSFRRAIVAETTARVGVFYTDFDYDSKIDSATKVKQIPNVDVDKIKKAIIGLEDVIKNYV